MIDYHVFRDLHNPKTRQISSDDAESFLDKMAGARYEPLSLDMLGLNIFNLMNFEASDSRYGARMSLVQCILAQAMYDDNYARFCEEEIKNLDERLNRLEKRYDSLSYKLSKSIDIHWEQILRKLGRPRYHDMFFNAMQNNYHERQGLEMTKIKCECAREIASVVKKVNEAYKSTPPSRVFYLTEMDHIFSGRKNSTGINITFVDETVREYGMELQETINKLWFKANGNYVPLTEEQLYGTFVEPI